MPDPTAAPAISWQSATVEKVAVETYRAKTFTLRLSEPRPFRAGQHYDVRLTAPDGYQAQRSYSVASAPDNFARIDLTVEIIPDGEVSPYFHEVVEPGDVLEVRGPIGGPFTWAPDLAGPLLLLAGGSGIVPLKSILMHRNLAAPDTPALLLYSTRGPEDIIYRKFLDSAGRRDAGVAVRCSLTRRQPPGWIGYDRRVDAAMLRECIDELVTMNGDTGTPLTYACGPTGFVEAAADALLSIGIAEESIRTERFGPTQ